MKKQLLASQWVRIDTVFIICFIIYFLSILLDIVGWIGAIVTFTVFFIISYLIYEYHIKEEETIQTLRELRK